MSLGRAQGSSQTDLSKKLRNRQVYYSHRLSLLSIAGKHEFRSLGATRIDEKQLFRNSYDRFVGQ